MSTTLRRSLLVAVTCVAAAFGASGAASGAASAATDSTLPVWTKLPTTTVQIGAELNTYVDPDCGNSWLPVTASWQAVDRESGIRNYVQQEPWVDPKNIGKTTSMPLIVYDDSAPCGGGSSESWFWAVNGAGLAGPMAYWNENRLSVMEDNSGRLTFRGPWSQSNCTCWSGGTSEKTTAGGASVLYRFSDSGNYYTVALVMAKGPDRGQATIYVDGVSQGRVDTYSETRINRTVVWRQVVTPGTHHVRVVNLATPGHARIDIDAFLEVRRDSVLQSPPT